MSALEFAILCLALALAASLAAHLLLQQYSQRKRDALTTAIANAITGYFLQSHVKVSARCLAQKQRKHFLVFLDSEPHKRFRYSHIVEAVLIKHIEKTMGLHIDRVYWRFPLPEPTRAEGHTAAPVTVAPALSAATQDTPASGTQNASTAAEKSIAAQEDEYITQGLLRAKVRHDYLVDEGSWDLFEKAMQDGELATSPHDVNSNDSDAGRDAEAKGAPPDAEPQRPA